MGFKHIVINIDYLGDQIRAQLGDGSGYGLEVQYSDESNTGALETAGGIKKALPLINSERFVCLNADVFTDFQFYKLLNKAENQTTAHLVLVSNPEHNPMGDFDLTPNGLLSENQGESLTFSGISLLSRTLFDDIPSGKQALAPILRKAIAEGKVTGEFHSGQWDDIGTPERLRDINQSQINN